MGVPDKSAATPKDYICRNCPHSTPRDINTIFCRVREHAIPAGAPCCGLSLITWENIPWFQLPWTKMGARHKQDVIGLSKVQKSPKN